MSSYSFTQNILSEVQVPPQGTVNRTIHNDDQTKIIVFGFAAGAELKAHAAPVPATIQILSGDVTLTLGPDIRDASAGALVHMTPHLMHSIVAKTPAIVLLTLLKATQPNAV